MNKLIITISLVLVTISAFAASFSPQVIKIYDEEELDQLLEDGVEILRRRGDILLCLVPIESDDEIVIPNSSRKVKARKPKSTRSAGKNQDIRDFAGLITPTLNTAVYNYDAADILTGKGFDQPFTGKGIVVGICDIGFDPLHPTFLDENGKSRVKRVTQYKEREGFRLQIEGDDQYRDWVTDNAEKFHATHVCGILAGNGAGSPYAGIARDADIVVSTSTLTDVGLLCGVEDIIDYAKEVGKPAVINLSVGSYTGAHDGTSLFSQYLDLCADDAIIVLSAGNEGNRTNTLSYTFTEDKDNVGFRLGNAAWDQCDMYGITDIWGYDDSPLTVELSIFDDENHEIIYTYPPCTLDDYDSITLTWDPENPDVEGCPLSGYVYVTEGIDPENGQRQLALMYDYESPEKTTGGWARYVLAVNVKGDPGNSIDVFADGTYTRLMQLSGNPLPNTAMSISDLACGYRVLSVGMYANPSPATVAYSSYGTLHDGRMLPNTVAPGYSLISSLSRQYLAVNPETKHITTNNENTENNKNTENTTPWISEGGTSMASPYVAGFIATWLEAFPSLTFEDIKSAILSTNHTDIPDADNPHNANGWFDPKDALIRLIHNSGVVLAKENPRKINPEDDIIVYSYSGMILYRGKAQNCTLPLKATQNIVRVLGK